MLGTLSNIFIDFGKVKISVLNVTVTFVFVIAIDNRELLDIYGNVFKGTHLMFKTLYRGRWV